MEAEHLARISDSRLSSRESARKSVPLPNAGRSGLISSARIPFRSYTAPIYRQPLMLRSFVGVHRKGKNDIIPTIQETELTRIRHGV